MITAGHSKFLNVKLLVLLVYLLTWWLVAAQHSPLQSTNNPFRLHYAESITFISNFNLLAFNLNLESIIKERGR